MTITGVDNKVDEPDRSVTVSATVTGGHGLSAPAEVTLTIVDDDGAPTLTLSLSSTSIRREPRDGQRHRIAQRCILGGRDGRPCRRVPVSPAVGGDFTLSNNTLTIAAGATTSAETATITGIDNSVDAPDKSVTVSATVSGGHGVSAPQDVTLTIVDDDGAPTLTLSLSSSLHQRERRDGQRHRLAERGVLGGSDSGRVGESGVACRKR